MKRLFIILACMLSFGVLQAQRPFVIFGNVDKNIFSDTADSQKAINGVFLWSLDAVVSGAEITYNKEASLFETNFLSGVGGAIGWKHYKPLADGTPVSDWGLNLAVLTQVKVNEVVRTGMEIAVLANLYNITAGPVYIFNDKKLGLLVGVNLTF